MTHHAAIAHLARCLQSAREERHLDPVGPRWVEGSLLAYEQLAILSPDEAARWRDRLADPDPASLDEDARGWAERVRPDAERYLARLDGAERRGAIDALAAVGVAEPEPRSRGGSSFAGGGGSSGFGDADEDDLDSPLEALEPRTVERVVTGSTDRHDGLALVAVVVHEVSTTLHFHYTGAGLALRGAERFDELLERFAPPALRDDGGRDYLPVEEQPIGLSGSDAALQGEWIYTPAAPDRARTFTAERGGHRWVLPAG